MNLVARLTVSFLAVFLLVLAAISVVAYVFFAHLYRSELGPALPLPEVQAALAGALRRVAIAILTVDIPLVALVALASYLLARIAVRPLLDARQREIEFVADAAHELRTPLARIAALAQGAEPERSREAFTSIARIAVEASSMVGDLLTLARSAALNQEAREPVDLAAVLAATANEYRGNAASRGIAVEVETRSAIVDGEERRLRQMAANLLDNAVRHARSRVVARTESDGRWARLTVEDDGEGVPQPIHGRVFDRFFTQSGGTGLGLAICRWVARAHGGDIELAGRSRFVARLPALGQAFWPRRRSKL